MDPSKMPSASFHTRLYKHKAKTTRVVCKFGSKWESKDINDNYMSGGASPNSYVMLCCIVFLISRYMYDILNFYRQMLHLPQEKDATYIWDYLNFLETCNQTCRIIYSPTVCQASVTRCTSYKWGKRCTKVTYLCQFWYGTRFAILNG